MSTHFQPPQTSDPYAPPPREPRSTIWIWIAGILAVLLMVCALLVFVILPGAFTRYGGSAMAGLLSSMCQIYYPDLETQTCNAWGQDIFENHLDEYQECNEQSQEASGQVDPDEFFTCLDDKGIGPKS
jgi:hypothetical protein